MRHAGDPACRIRPIVLAGAGEREGMRSLRTPEETVAGIGLRLASRRRIPATSMFGLCVSMSRAQRVVKVITRE